MSNNKLSKENFIKILDILRNYNKSASDIYKSGIDLINYTDNYYGIIGILMEHIYGKDGNSIVQDWVYQSWNGQIFDKNNQIIREIKSDEDLWVYLEKDFYIN
jgi:hypothetical protein